MTRIRSLSMRWVGPYNIYYFYHFPRGFNAGYNNPRPLRLIYFVWACLTFWGSHASR